MNARWPLLLALSTTPLFGCAEEKDPPNPPTLSGLAATCELVERTWLLTRVDFTAVDKDGVEDLLPPSVVVENVASLDAADFTVTPAADGTTQAYRWERPSTGDAFFCGDDGSPQAGTLLTLLVSVEDKAGFPAQLKVRSKPL